MVERKHRRIEYEGSVSATAPNGDDVSLDVLDYSIGGMGVLSEIPCEQGDILKLHELVTHDGHRRPLNMDGEVIYVQRGEHLYTIGVSFL